MALDYCTVRGTTERLAAPLSAEDQTVQSMPDASPTKWHRAHTTWFFETFVLGDRGGSRPPYDPAYGYLFNSYYDAVGPRHARHQRGMLTRPSADEVGAYRRAIDAEMMALLAGDVDDAIAGLVTLGLHHEQQHQELLLMDIKHAFSLNPLLPAYTPTPAAPADDGRVRPLRWRAHEGGVHEIGHDGTGFSFDNETPRHAVALQPFEIASQLVTCDEWQAFVDDGGYARPELWMSDGWATVVAQQWAAPLYWIDGDVFTLHGLRPRHGGEPVSHVGWYEADAYARWTGHRLPTEAEWEIAAGAAIDGEQWHGEVWQWTASPYTAYPGFRPAAGAVGEYNGKFMVNQQVLRGSSCLTPAGHARSTYRNFFPPAARWACSGLRLARDAA